MPGSDRDKFLRLTFQKNIKDIEKIYNVFQRRGISPVLIKGLASAVNYPKPFQRVFSDIDLAVSTEDYQNASDIIKMNNFNIDLHKGLRHLDTLGWNDLFANSKIIKIENISVRVLSEEDHLRVLCIHWLNDGGADRTRLWDIFFALEKTAETLDWDKFLGVVSEKRKLWLLTVILAVREFLGLDVKRLKFDFDNRHLPEWVKRELEKEWKSDVRLIPLQRVSADKRMFLRQIMKRFPPNILQAIVETDSELSSDGNYIIRFKDFVKRAKPSLEGFFRGEC